MPDPPHESEPMDSAPVDGGEARGWGPPSLDRRDVALMVVAGALLFGLSLYRLGELSFWRDEIASVVFAQAPVSELTKILDRSRPVAGLANMASYYLILHFWSWIADTEAELRLLSVIFGAAAVVPVYLVARRVGGRWAPGIAAFLFAASPTVIEWNQQARGYSLAMLVCAGLTLLVIYAAERRNLRLWLAYGLVAAFGIYVHFFVGLVIAAHAGWVLATRSWGSWKALLAVGVPIAIASAPLPFLVFRYGGGHEWIPDLTLEQATRSLEQLAGGPWLLVVLVLLAGAALVLHRRNRWMWLVAASALVPLIGIAAISVVKPMFIGRYVVVATPAIAMLAGVGLAAVRPIQARAALGAAVVLATVVALPSAYTDTRQEDWRSTGAWVSQHAAPGDRIYMRSWSVRPMTYYLHRFGATPTPERIRLDAALAEPQPERLWIILPDPDTRSAEEARLRLEGVYQIIDERSFGTNVRLLLAEPMTASDPG